MAFTDHYRNPSAPRPSNVVPSAAAIVADRAGHIVLVHRRDDGLWALPGGAMELGESIADCAVREVRVGTGLDVRVTGLVGVYTNPNHVIEYADGEVRQQFSLCFTTDFLGGTLVHDPGVTEVAWVETRRVPEIDMDPSTRLRIIHWLERRPRPYLG